MELSIQTPQFQTSIAELTETWRHAERLGFRSAWLMDHLVPILVPDTEPMLEAWTTLTAVLSATETIRGGVLVSAATFRHPALLARMAATLDHISGGRLEVGIGAAWCEPEHVANGLAFPPARDRLTILAEACSVLRLLWTEPEATFEGRHFNVRAARCEPKPIQTPLPMLIGGGGEKRTLRIVAQHADRWNGSGSIPMMRHKIEVLHEHCAAIGRDPKTLALTIRNELIITPDRAEADRRLGEMAAFWGVDVEAARARTWVGNVEEVTGWLIEYRDLGFDEAILTVDPPYATRAVEMLEMVAAETLPALA